MEDIKLKTEYLKIDMELVREIIRDKGYYYITAERLFDKRFVGSKLYIVTDDPDFKEKHPQLAEMTIMSVVEFEPIAQVVNDYIGQEDKERQRERIDIESHEVQNLITDESIDQVSLRQAISALDTLQRERLISYYFYGESFTEIARRQNVSARAVSYSIRLAEKKIKEYYCTFTKK